MVGYAVGKWTDGAGCIKASLSFEVMGKYPIAVYASGDAG